MLYLIGLGLNLKGISKEGIDAVKNCEKVYLEDYTVDFPYSVKELEKFLGKKVIIANRDFVEGLEFLEEVKNRDIGILVYGSPLFATTHITILDEARKKKIKTKVIYSASVFDAIGKTGLQLYKFGKIASMPNFEANSFMEIVKENSQINAHSLILVDIGMEFKTALDKLEVAAKEKNFSLGKIVVCSKLGTKEENIFYGELGNLKKKKVENPYCFIIPGKLHFVEEEVLENLKK